MSKSRHYFIGSALTLLVATACGPAPSKTTVPTANVPIAAAPASVSGAASTPPAGPASAPPPPPRVVARSGKQRKAQCAPEPQIADRLDKSACAKKLKDPTSGAPAVSLALGQCEERAGRLVEALAAYESGRQFDLRRPPFSTATAAAKQSQALLAVYTSLEQHETAVAPRIPQIRFQVHGAAPTVLWIDDDPVAIGTLAGSYGVNPGKHHIVASGPGGRFEETFSIAEGGLHATDMTLAEAPEDWPRWVPHDDLECRLDKMMTYPQARNTNDCEAEKAAALGTNTTTEALALARCYERARLFPLSCQALIEAQLRNPTKAEQTMEHRYSLGYMPRPAPTKESLDLAMTLLAERSRICPKGW